MADNTTGKFNPLVIDGRRPIESVFKIGGWILVTPAIVALVWGAYQSDSFMGVVGISARRAGGSFVQETRPIGESLVNGTSGKGLRPGGFDQNNQYELRPGSGSR